MSELHGEILYSLTAGDPNIKEIFLEHLLGHECFLFMLSLMLEKAKGNYLFFYRIVQAALKPCEQLTILALHSTRLFQ